MVSGTGCRPPVLAGDGGEWLGVPGVAPRPQFRVFAEPGETGDNGQVPVLRVGRFARADAGPGCAHTAGSDERRSRAAMQLIHRAATSITRCTVAEPSDGHHLTVPTHAEKREADGYAFSSARDCR